MTKRARKIILLPWLYCGAASIICTPTALFAQMGYNRDDYTSAVVYEGNNFDIYELSLPLGLPFQEVWSLANLSALTGAPPADAGPSLSDAGEPFGYVRGDPTNAVVYRGSSKHIYELSLFPYGHPWELADLTAKTGAPDAAWGPVGYRRSDNTSSVVYVGMNAHIYEIYLPYGGAWAFGDLSYLTGAPAAAPAAPAAYIRSDNVNAVVYRGTNGHIYEISLALNAAAWSVADLSSLTGAPAAALGPVGYRRADNVNAVLFVGAANSHIYELSLPLNGKAWSLADLTAKTGAPAAATIPSAFVRSDQVDSVQYVGMNTTQICELYLPLNGAWGWGELSKLTGAPPFGLAGATPEPYGYARVDQTNAIVYCGNDGDILELSLPNGGPAWEIGNLSLKAGVTGCSPQVVE